MCLFHLDISHPSISIVRIHARGPIVNSSKGCTNQQAKRDHCFELYIGWHANRACAFLSSSCYLRWSLLIFLVCMSGLFWGPQEAHKFGHLDLWNKSLQRKEENTQNLCGAASRFLRGYNCNTQVLTGANKCSVCNQIDTGFPKESNLPSLLAGKPFRISWHLRLPLSLKHGRYQMHDLALDNEHKGTTNQSNQQ